MEESASLTAELPLDSESKDSLESVLASLTTLVGADLSGLDLSGRDLRGADLSRANLTGARLFGCRLDGATLFEVQAKGAEFACANLTGATLTHGDFSGAGFGRADLRDADARGAKFDGALLTDADLRDAQLDGCSLKSARLVGAHLEHASLVAADLTDVDASGAHVGGARFRGVRFGQARLGALTDYRSADWVGADASSIEHVGTALLRSIIEHQNYVDEFRRQGRLYEWLYRLWWVTSDCGRSAVRWSVCGCAIALAFGLVYTQVGIDYGESPTPLSPFYFSIVTFTTLGFGDIVPRTATAQAVVMAEVIIGYVMLGGLMSLLSNKLSRSST